MNRIYQHKYNTSRAVIVGINEYKKLQKLEYAVNDANGIANCLNKKFGFERENLIKLLDDEASRQKILQTYLALTETADENDRIVFFFAGHGFTRSGRRKEAGFLVPSDGDPEDLSTLIQWDEITRSSDLIPAKHILYIIDACYGGVALSRSVPDGSRFLKDMLARFSRQVLTAGKANEVVADSGGPIDGHSIFTGHLLNALKGKAYSKDNILNANRVMAYVYEKVATDAHSDQTPHHGLLAGDGDFIFDAPILGSNPSEEKEGSDIIIESPIVSYPQSDHNKTDSLEETIKEYLSEPRYRINLFDFIKTEIEVYLQKINALEFSSDSKTVEPQEFSERVRLYEDVTERLIKVSIILGYWSETDHYTLIEKIITRVADREFERTGKNIWVYLNYYPLTLISYAGGISSIAKGNFNALHRLLLTPVPKLYNTNEIEEVIVTLTDANSELDEAKAFNLLPEHKKFYVPRSEYLFKFLQSKVEDLLQLGKQYEDCFDRYEMFYALCYADIMKRQGFNFWSAHGRFVWKHRSLRTKSPLTTLMDEAISKGNSWEPIQAQIFSSSKRFQEIVEGYDNCISKLSWH